MENRKEHGVVDLPILLVVCLFLSLLAVGIGNRAIDRFDSLKSDQSSISIFNEFIEKAAKTCYGELNNEKRINLDLKNHKITIENNLIQLKEGREVIRSEYLPIPMILTNNDNKIIRNGILTLKLSENKNNSADGLFIEIKRGLQ